MRPPAPTDAYLQHETMRVVAPYLVLGVVALIWASSSGEPVSRARRGHMTSAGEHGRFRELLRYPHFLLASRRAVLYVGAQVGTWSYFIQYAQDYTHRRKRSRDTSSPVPSVAFGVGRFGSAALMRYVCPSLPHGLYASPISFWSRSASSSLAGWDCGPSSSPASSCR